MRSDTFLAIAGQSLSRRGSRWSDWYASGNHCVKKLAGVSMRRFRFVAITLLALTPYAVAGTTDQETQYVCAFQAKVQMVSVSAVSPTSITRRDPKRFTFIDSGRGSGSYINLEFGTKLPAIVLRNAGYTVFIEDLSGIADNHFVVTIFNGTRDSGKYRAVMSLHSDVPIEFYNPSQAIGECTETI